MRRPGTNSFDTRQSSLRRSRRSRIPNQDYRILPRCSEVMPERSVCFFVTNLQTLRQCWPSTSTNSLDPWNTNMSVTFSQCGSVVTAGSEIPTLSGSRWGSHRIGKCPRCGKTIQWHRAISGRSGTGYVFSESREAVPLRLSAPRSSRPHCQPDLRDPCPFWLSSLRVTSVTLWPRLPGTCGFSRLDPARRLGKFDSHQRGDSSPIQTRTKFLRNHNGAIARRSRFS